MVVSVAGSIIVWPRPFSCRGGAEGEEVNNKLETIEELTRLLKQDAGVEHHQEMSCRCVE